MQQPIAVDIPHKLGKDEARRRIASNIHKLQDHIPGGAETHATWSGDEMTLNVAAMGQTIETRILIEEAQVRVRVVLPGMLGFFAKPIEAMLKQKGGDLLLENKKD